MSAMYVSKASRSIKSIDGICLADVVRKASSDWSRYLTTLSVSEKSFMGRENTLHPTKEIIAGSW